MEALMPTRSVPKTRIPGKSIDLRPAVPEDAAFVLRLRTDPTLNRHLNPTSSDLAAQETWMRDCHADPGQYNFIIEDRQAMPQGTVRIYDFRPDSFCWGSWIVQPGAPRKAAIESALLVYEFGYFGLDFGNCHFDVRKDNARVIDFHRRFGARLVGETAQDFLFSLSRSEYLASRSQYRAFLPQDITDTRS